MEAFASEFPQKYRGRIDCMDIFTFESPFKIICSIHQYKHLPFSYFMLSIKYEEVNAHTDVLICNFCVGGLKIYG